MTRMNVFEIISQNINNQYNEYIRSATAGLEASPDRIRRNLTPAKLRRYEAGELSQQEAAAIAADRIRRQYEKDAAAAIAKAETVCSTDQPDTITIAIEWKKSTIWGYNPTATITAETAKRIYRTAGKASGCGYDKRSAAVASALNDNLSILSAVYAKRAADNEAATRDIFGYGMYEAATPYFEGGCGINSTLNNLKSMGYKLITEHGTKTTDFYYLVREGGSN